METDVQNDDLNVSLKQDAALENGKYTIFVEIINWVYIGITNSAPNKVGLLTQYINQIILYVI